MEGEKYEYVINVFHELKSPLTTIMLASGIVKDYNLDNSGREAYLVMIVNECIRMKNIINNTINALKNNYFDVDINQKCDINEIIKRVVESENIGDIGLYLMASRHVVNGNVDYLESAFRELFENARKYRSERPLRVSVKTFNKGDKIKICFSDNGIGMTKKTQAEIFNKDFHNDSDNYNVEDQYNTGLGLYFLKRNIQRINGAITVESKIGRGSVFTITLPLIV